jgi:hypothetical protein
MHQSEQRLKNSTQKTVRKRRSSGKRDLSIFKTALKLYYFEKLSTLKRCKISIHFQWYIVRVNLTNGLKIQHIKLYENIEFREIEV